MTAHAPDEDVESTGTGLTIRRTYAAPPDRVWGAITDPEAVSRWFAPGTRTCAIGAWDFREDGAFEVTFVATEDDGFGEVPPVRGTFPVIEPGEAVTMTWAPSDQPDGGPAADGRITFRLAPAEAGTRLTFTHEGLPGEDAVAQATAGWRATLPKLDRLFE